MSAHGRYPEVAFRRIFKQLRRPVEPEATIVTAYTNGDVTLRSNRRLDGYHEAADLSGFQGVEPGDFVVHGLDILRGSIGVSDSRGAISSVCIVCRPRRADDPRFFAYVMRAQAFSGFPRAMARGVREGGADFRRWDTLADLPLPRPEPKVQRRIANFLDSETARIDTLIDKKRRIISATVDKEAAVVSAIWEEAADRWGVSRLGRHLLRMEQGWSPQCDDRTAGPDEYGVVKAGCVNGGRFRAAEHKVLPADTVPRLEYLLRPGDLLVSRASGSLDLIGSAAVVPEDGPRNLLLCDKVYRLRVDGNTSAVFLALMLRARQVREAIKLGVSGGEGMANNLPGGVVRGLPLPVVPNNEQCAIVARLQFQQAAVARLVRRLSRSIELLIERRQALITAAVTGELDVRGVAV